MLDSIHCTIERSEWKNRNKILKTEKSFNTLSRKMEWHVTYERVTRCFIWNTIIHDYSKNVALERLILRWSQEKPFTL